MVHLSCVGLVWSGNDSYNIQTDDVFKNKNKYKLANPHPHVLVATQSDCECEQKHSWK